MNIAKIEKKLKELESQTNANIELIKMMIMRSSQFGIEKEHLLGTISGSLSKLNNAETKEINDYMNEWYPN